MQKSLVAGVSITNVTPPVGLQLCGYPYYCRQNTGVHDPLYASCIVLDNGECKVAIVAADLVGFTKRITRNVRDRVSKLTTIPAKNISLCGSHTHSGPWIFDSLNYDELKKEWKPDEAYLKELEDKMVELVLDADSHTFEAKLGVEIGYCGKEQGVGGNRRDPAGLADPDVCVIGVKDIKDNWKACLVKYSLHPTVIHGESTLVTADYPGYMREYLKKTKPGMNMLFVQGTSGNQSTRYFRNGQTFEESERIGNAIGKEVERVLNSMALSTNVKLAVSSEEKDIELRKLPTREEAERNVREAEEKLKKLEENNAPYVEYQTADLWLLGYRNILGYIKIKEEGSKMSVRDGEIPEEVQVIRIADAAMVCLQGETFVEFGLEIKAKSPFKKTFVVTVANGIMAGYTCTAEAYREGGYETGASFFTETKGELIVNTAVKLLNEID